MICASETWTIDKRGHKKTAGFRIEDMEKEEKTIGTNHKPNEEVMAMVREKYELIKLWYRTVRLMYMYTI